MARPRAAEAVAPLLLAHALLANAALAEKPHRDVRLAIEDCTPSALNLHDAYAAAALELGLGDSAAPAAKERSQVELRAAFACEHGVKARLTLKTANQSASRTVSLDDVRRKDRPRVLALALAELVRAEWRWVTTGKSEETEPPAGDERSSGAAAVARDETKPSDAAATAGAAAAKDTRASSDAPTENGTKSNTPAPPAKVPAHASDASPAPGDERRDTLESGADTPLRDAPFVLEVLGRARELFEGPTFVYGAAAGTRWHRWSAGVEALFGRADGELGTASVGFADARLGYEVWRTTPGHWLFGVEPGLAGGVTWLNGTGATPDVKVSNATAFYGDVRLAFRAEYRARLVSPALSVEAGRALGLAAKENGTTMAVTGGWFLGAAVGVVVRGRN